MNLLKFMPQLNEKDLRNIAGWLEGRNCLHVKAGGYKISRDETALLDFEKLKVRAHNYLMRYPQGLTSGTARKLFGDLFGDLLATPEQVKRFEK